MGTIEWVYLICAIVTMAAVLAIEAESERLDNTSFWAGLLTGLMWPVFWLAVLFRPLIKRMMR